MTTFVTVLTAIAILTGLAGIVIPVLPGVLLIWLAALLWGFAAGLTPWWPLAAIITPVYAAGIVLQGLIPGQQMKRAGIPSSTLLLGVAGGIAGFFIIPVVGFIAGFITGVWAAEAARVGLADSWPSARHALRAAAVSYGLEFATGLTIAVVWAVFAARLLLAS